MIMEGFKLFQHRYCSEDTNYYSISDIIDIYIHEYINLNDANISTNILGTVRFDSKSYYKVVNIQLFTYEHGASTQTIKTFESSFQNSKQISKKFYNSKCLNEHLDSLINKRLRVKTIDKLIDI